MSALVWWAQGLLLWVGAFNRLAGIFVRGGASVWEDDYEMRTPAAAQVRPLLRGQAHLPCCCQRLCDRLLSLAVWRSTSARM